MIRGFERETSKSVFDHCIIDVANLLRESESSLSQLVSQKTVFSGFDHHNGLKTSSEAPDPLT